MSNNNTPHSTAKEQIWQLAQQHGIEHHHSKLDDLGEAISLLADDRVELDPTQWLLIELGRAQVITGREQMALNTRYMQESKL